MLLKTIALFLSQQDTKNQRQMFNVPKVEVDFEPYGLFLQCCQETVRKRILESSHVLFDFSIQKRKDVWWEHDCQTDNSDTDGDFRALNPQIRKSNIPDMDSENFLDMQRQFGYSDQYTPLFRALWLLWGIVLIRLFIWWDKKPMKSGKKAILSSEFSNSFGGLCFFINLHL